MNDTGGGVTAIHDVPGDITRIGFHWMLFFPFCHSKGASSICSSRGVSRRSRGFFVPNLRILELFLHTDCRGGHGFFGPDFFPCPEFANLRIFSSHGESRNNLFYHELSIIFYTECHGGHGFFLITRLGLGPTDRREVIFEFANIFHTDCRGIIFLSRIIELSNIFHTECRGDHGVSLSRDLSLAPLTAGR